MGIQREGTYEVRQLRPARVRVRAPSPPVLPRGTSVEFPPRVFKVPQMRILLMLREEEKMGKDAVPWMKFVNGHHTRPDLRDALVARGFIIIEKRDTIGKPPAQFLQLTEMGRREADRLISEGNSADRIVVGKYRPFIFLFGRSVGRC